MSETEYIIGVYDSLDHYYLLYLLDQKGLLEQSAARKLYETQFKSQENNNSIENQNAIGPFESIDSLNQFAFRLCEELNAQKVSLVSVSEYNALLEKNQIASDFYRDLLLKGSVMENIERKKKGFLSRFF